MIALHVAANTGMLVDSYDTGLARLAAGLGILAATDPTSLPGGRDICAECWDEGKR